MYQQEELEIEQVQLTTPKSEGNKNEIRIPVITQEEERNNEKN